jgi:hypothetical protein
MWQKKCSSHRLKDDRFCSNHVRTCLLFDCMNDSLTPFEYCTKHKCAGSDCGLAHKSAQETCEAHLYCAYPGCRIVCELDYPACDEHRCRRDGCYKATCAEETEYCEDGMYIPIFSKSGCQNPRDSILDARVKHPYCGNHYSAI